MAAMLGDARDMQFDPAFFEPFDGVLWAAQLMLEEEEAFCVAALRANGQKRQGVHFYQRHQPAVTANQW